jgi:hypothetical protein
MAITEKVSGVGANASRTDKNLSERVARVQRDAKMQNATGGPYRSRADLEAIAGGASTNVPTPSPTAPQGNLIADSVPAVNAFAPGSQDLPLSHGAAGGPGAAALCANAHCVGSAGAPL